MAKKVKAIIKIRFKFTLLPVTTYSTSNKYVCGGEKEEEKEEVYGF
jgi:hypothetical protein